MSRTAAAFEAHQQALQGLEITIATITPVSEEAARKRALTYDFEKPFGQMALRLCYGFLDTFSEQEQLPFGDESVQSAFLVTARGIAQCQASYERFCANMDRPYETPVLEAALRSPKTVRFMLDISRMHAKKNREFEAWLELKNEYGSAQNFIYDASEGYFIPNEQIMTTAREAADRIHTPPEEIPFRRCPATHLIPHLWQRTVTQAAEEGLLETRAVPVGVYDA